MRFLGVLLLLVNCLFGETFIKEYTYHASESDSKLSARKAALDQIRMLAIEEVGVNVNSFFSNEQIVEGEKVSGRIASKLEIFSQAFTQTKILEERWNGEDFYIKVKIVVDPDKITQKIKASQTQSPEQICEGLKNEAIHRLYDLSSSEKITSYVDFAVGHEFNNCHDWHYAVMRTFMNHKINPKTYRTFLLTTLKNIPSPSEDKRSIAIINYLLENLSTSEFDTIFANMKKMQSHTFNEALAVLAQNKNPIKPYCYDTFFTVSHKKVVGRPIAFSVANLTNYLLYSLSYRDAEMFTKYYLLHQEALTKEQRYAFYKVFKRMYFKRPNQKHFDIIVTYLKALTPSARTSAELYDFISYAQTESKNNRAHLPFITQFMKKLQQQMNASFPYTDYYSGVIDRKKLFIQYNVQASYTPTPQQCAKEIMNQSDENLQLESIEYLFLMDERAYPAEKAMIQTLKKAKKGSSITSSVMEKKLIQTLANIKTKNTKAIYLIVGSLSSKRHKVSLTAKEALIKIGYPSFGVMKDLFLTQEDYVKARMLEIMGTFQENKKSVIAFLNSIITSNKYLQKVKEETINELKY